MVLAYILAIGSLMIPLGRVADMIGPRRIYVIGAALFVAGAVAAGLAPGLASLAGLKALQGVGNAAIQATSMAILTTAFPPGQRGRAIGLYMLVGGSGFIFGPLAGGSVISWLGWRWMVFMPVPFALVSLAAVLWLGGTGQGAREGRTGPFDWPGSALSTGAVVALLLTMSNANSWGWTSPAVAGGLALSVALAVGFLLWERRAQEPLLPPDLLTNAPFARGLTLTALIILGNVPVFVLMPFYIEDVLGHSAAVSGLIMASAAVAFTATGPLVGYLSDRFDWRIFVTSSTVVIALAMMLMSLLSASAPLWTVWGLIIMLGVGIGLWYSPTTSVALSRIEKSRQGVGTSATLMVRYASNVTTVAVAISIVTATMAARGFVPSLSAVGDGAEAGAAAAFVEGMSLAFRIGAGVILLATLVTIAPIDRLWPGPRAHAGG